MKNIDSVQLIELSKQIHGYQLRKGFWDVERSIDHHMMMIITEISEAVEADRRDKRAQMDEYNYWKPVLIRQAQFRDFPDLYRKDIKNTIEEEFSDIAIRSIGIAIHLGMDYYDFEIMDTPAAMPEHDFTNHTFSENAITIIRFITNHECSHMAAALTVLHNIFQWAASMDIDLISHIKLKLEYLNFNLPSFTVKKY